MSIYITQRENGNHCAVIAPMDNNVYLSTAFIKTDDSDEEVPCLIAYEGEDHGGCHGKLSSSSGVAELSQSTAVWYCMTKTEQVDSLIRMAQKVRNFLTDKDRLCEGCWELPVHCECPAIIMEDVSE